MLTALRSWLGRKPQTRPTAAPRTRLDCARLEDRLTPTGLPPAVLIDGAPTVGEGSEYRLNLTAIDPENDLVSGWTINWGDGNTQTITGNPSSVTHTYDLGVARRVNVSASAVVGGEAFSAKVSSLGANLGEFVSGDAQNLLRPYSMAFAGDLTGDGVNDLYVGEFYSLEESRILAFDGVTGAFFDTVAAYANGLTERPVDMVAGADGVLYIASRDAGVLRFDPATGQLSTFAVSNTQTGTLTATSVAVNPAGEVFVVDQGSVSRVLRYSSSGTFQGVYATSNSTSIGPIRVGPNGDLYAVATEQVEVNRTLSKVVRHRGPGWEDVVPLGDRELGKQYAVGISNSFPTPRIAFGPDGDLYVAAPVDQRTSILRYDAESGEYLGKIAAEHIDRIGNMAFSPAGDLYASTFDFGMVSNTTSYVARFSGPTTVTGTESLPVTVLDAVTTTYTSNPNATITSNSWTIDVPNGGSILDVNVGLNVTHGNVQELQVYLVSPSGTRVALVRGVEVAGANFTNTVFDDEAATAITSGNAPFTGSFRPMRNLSDFDGEQVAGTWTLEISDGVKGNRGTLVNWSLEITRGVGPGGEPPVAVNDVVQMTAGTASVNIAALANDSDPEGGPLTIASFTPPPTDQGTVVRESDDTFTYTPPSTSFTGTVTFTYTITDIDGNTSTATVTINVVSSGGGGGGGKGGGRK